jgi:16S rRNA (cytosine967-C5)-methyltransferase
VIAPARTSAFHALRALASGRVDLPVALARTRAHLADERDRSLAAEIVSGTVRWQRSLNHVISHFARRPLNKFDADVLTILRLSVYQLLHLDRVPASAVVDDAVDLARAARKPSAAGFVNAVLRAMLRQKNRLPLPTRPDHAAGRDAALAYLGITHSHPDWLVQRWLERHGFDGAERWVRFNNETPQLTIRVNGLRAEREQLANALAAEGIETEPTRYAPDGLIVTVGNPLRLAPDGSFFVQDEASQLIPLVVGARPGERVLDLCASPGGKSTAMAADMADSGVLAACDVRDKRIALLRQTVHASGAHHVHVIRIATAGTLPFAPVFDRVLVDAPCSGLGTLRRDPDIKWRRVEADLPRLASDQLALVKRAADVLAPGGRLVYATCSSEPEENEGVVEAFLREHHDFQLIDLRAECPDSLQPLLDDRGMLRTLPFAHGLEAFFAAALTRRGS